VQVRTLLLEKYRQGGKGPGFVFARRLSIPSAHGRHSLIGADGCGTQSCTAAVSLSGRACDGKRYRGKQAADHTSAPPPAFVAA
jgi:hypothetical protein